MPIVDLTANVWSISIVARSDGHITVAPVNVPMVLYKRVLAALEQSRVGGRDVTAPEVR